MRIDLAGRTALVTGSTQGIGAAIAAGLTEAGAAVAVNGRDSDRVEQAVEELRRKVPHGNVSAVPADVATEEGALQAFEQVPDVDILVNNVGIFGSKDVLEIDDAEWRHYFDVNVFSAVRLTRLYMPRMLKQNWGRVLYIASESSVAVSAEMVHYGTTKTAMLALGRGFAKRAAGTSVTVNSVLAGPTHTEGVEEFVYNLVGRDAPWHEAEAAFMRQFRPQSLLQRLIEPAEIANMVVYLSSDQASATIGGAIRVEGGIVDAIVP